MGAPPVLLFDGECGLCDATVRFVLRHERAGEFRFAALQSPQARALLAPFGVDGRDLSTMFVLEDRRLWRESDAVVRLLQRLRLPYRLLAALLSMLPRPLRDRGYRFVGARRQAWRGAGASTTCAMLPAAVRARFLDRSGP